MAVDKKIKICHLISGDLWAGAEVQAYTQVDCLRHLSEVEMAVIVLNDGKLAAQLRKADVQVSVVEESKNSFPRLLTIIAGMLDGRDIDILHTHRYKENILAALVRKRCGIRALVQTVHGIEERLKGVKRAKAALYARLNARYTRHYFDKIIAVSDDIRSRLGESILPDHIVMIHNSIALPDPRELKDPSLTRDNLGLPDKQAVLGSAGRMMPVKGYDLFLKMAGIILEKRPLTGFLLAGDGPLKQSLEDMARRRGLEGKIVFPGFRDDITDVINCLDVFVISSHHEGIPMALLEAMALGKPVVATAVGGVPEVIEHGISGLLVQPGDHGGLANACLQILEKPAVAESLGRAARHRVESEFSIDVHREKIMRLYREVLGGK
jgi:glycosyltransferase involved in cell wall biosynthesis